MDRGAWQATVKKLQEWDMTEVTEHSTAYVCVCVCVCVWVYNIYITEMLTTVKLVDI